jgi:hypothetical protein
VATRSAPQRLLWLENNDAQAAQADIEERVADRHEIAERQRGRAFAVVGNQRQLPAGAPERQ